MCSFFGFSQEKTTLIYTGTMGVYIKDGQSSVLIDGLHTKYGDDYLFPPKRLVHKINTALKPNVILPHWMSSQKNTATLIKKYIHANTRIVTLISSKNKEKETLTLNSKYSNIHSLTKLE